MSKILLLFVALIVGTLLPIQAAFNAKMGRAISNPVAAAFISFAVGTVALFLYLILSRQPLSFSTAFRQAPWYAWLGGVLGTFYVASSVMLVPRLGVALTFSLVIVGQLMIALIMDHFGWFGVEIKVINFYRILGVIFLVAGVVLIRKF